MEKLSIGTLLWHPCNMDIIPHKIIGIRTYEDRVVYESQAISSVGACGKVKVLLTPDRNGMLRYIDFDESWRHEYESGLKDFVEGNYYTNQLEASLAYKEQQRILCQASMENRRREYEASKEQYDRVCKIIESIKKDLEDIR